MTRQNAWEWCEEGIFPSLFMSAWWFDADGRRSLPEPILDFLEAVQVTGILFEQDVE